MSYVPFQLHAVVMAGFASLFAPFGGFFASGFKRAFNIKDFGRSLSSFTNCQSKLPGLTVSPVVCLCAGHSIPGHGGMTDRMDCQFLMGLFAYVYYSSLIRVNTATPASVLQTIAAMTVDQQVEVVRNLSAFLAKKGVQW